jgi:hypothetical protein
VLVDQMLHLIVTDSLGTKSKVEFRPQELE